MDGIVNFDDLLRLAKNYNGTGKAWTQGDSNNDGFVTFGDLLLLAKNYNQSAAAFGADWSLAQSLVPEPTVSMALAALVPFGAKRRRTSSIVGRSLEHDEQITRGNR